MFGPDPSLDVYWGPIFMIKMMLQFKLICYMAFGRDGERFRARPRAAQHLLCVRGLVLPAPTHVSQPWLLRPPARPSPSPTDSYASRWTWHLLITTDMSILFTTEDIEISTSFYGKIRGILLCWAGMRTEPQLQAEFGDRMNWSAASQHSTAWILLVVPCFGLAFFFLLFERIWVSFFFFPSLWGDLG